ncbi:YihY/virulence factor BrkB family protein (plasmid) [Halorarum halophilum]|uniref:YihY/virulence factor BrkB family protein n=1 Tax=Halorarum halophilum TaxID=2743090 RepID=A0A7D5K3G8_9EURY|nr:YihY/virulence factor BrkB family protein [Halobaculum halophilum]QLG29661.1 YihY/virulence factor BrkB family protein [Halobaculum halophilum]
MFSRVPTSAEFSRALTTGRAVVSVLQDNYASFIAGSIAFAAFLSIPPLLALAVALAGILGATGIVAEALERADVYLTPTAQSLFLDALSSSEGRAGASLISVLILLWSALRVFRGLDTAFSLLYGSTEDLGIVDSARDGLVVLVALVVALAVSAGVATLIALFPTGPLGTVIAPVVLIVGLAVAFLPMYYVFPDTDVTVREVVPGAVVAAVGCATLAGGFRLYTGFADQYEVYGAIGAVLVVLLWLYGAGLMLLTGVAVNVVTSGRVDVAGGGGFDE